MTRNLFRPPSPPFAAARKTQGHSGAKAELSARLLVDALGWHGCTQLRLGRTYGAV